MNWRKAIENQFFIHNDSWKNVVSIVPEDKKWLDYLFDEDETVIFFAVGEKDQMTLDEVNNCCCCVNT